MAMKCKITVKKPKHNIDLKAYKREGQGGSVTYYGYSDKECKRLRKDLEID